MEPNVENRLESANYFGRVGTRQTCGTQGTLDGDGCDPALLIEFYKRQAILIKKNWTKIRLMFNDWRRLLNQDSPRNIAVIGRNSKCRLLRLFESKCLNQSNLQGDYNEYRADKSLRAIVYHGFCPPKFELFDRNLKTRIGRNSKTSRSNKKSVFVFVIHSFDTFHTKARTVSEAIIDLCVTRPSEFRLIMSIDHTNSKKILDCLQQALNLQLFSTEFGCSPFFEKTQTINLLNEPTTDDVKSILFQRHFDLQSIKDIYQALQRDCKQVMLYIMKDFVEKVEKMEAEKSGDSDDEVTLAGPVKSKSRLKNRRRVKKKQRVDMSSTCLKFSVLLDHCERNFIARRSNVLRGYLGELLDHNIIELDESGNLIRCRLSVPLCKEFLA